jgi:hypothetical protein
MAEILIDVNDLSGANDLSDSSGADLIWAVAAESNEELAAGLEEDFRQMTAAQGRFLVRLGEVARRHSFLDEGATSAQTWAVERFGVGAATARAYVHVGEKLLEVPHLLGALCAGEVSLDKIRAVVDVATPATEGELCEQARVCGVRELADIARMTAERQCRQPPARSEHDRRYLRCNDTFRTVTIQLPAESYAETKACLEARARAIPSDDEVSPGDEVSSEGAVGSEGQASAKGETPARGQRPWDQRLCDAFMDLMGAAARGSSSGGAPGSAFFVVAHVPLQALVEDAGDDALTGLAGELEHDGLISTEVVRRIACDATIAVALDDDVGHTMYEGRARRFPTGAQRREVMRRDRRCRFPGCSAVTFTHVHHIVAWKPGGRSDLDNLALLCRHHHGVVHRKGWTMTGNANEELTFLGPRGRVMTSRPSPLWARATAGRRSGGSG